MRQDWVTHKWYRFNDAQVELIDEKSLLEEIGAREPAAATEGGAVAEEGDAATTADAAAADATTATGTATTATASADTAAAASDTTSDKGTDAATTGAGGGAGGGAGAGADGDDKVTKDGSTITPKKEKKEEVPKQAGGDPMANAYMLVYRRVDDSTAPKPITDKVTDAHT